MEFQLFRRITQRIEIDEISEILRSENIKFKISSPASLLGSSFGEAKHEFFELYIAEKDFASVKSLLEKRAEAIAQTINSNHYLYTFSDDELKDVLNQPEDWNEIDVFLAIKILNERKVEFQNTATFDTAAAVENIKPTSFEIKDSLGYNLRYYSLLITSTCIVVIVILYFIFYDSNLTENNVIIITIVLITINVFYYESKHTCPNCKERHNTELIVKIEQGDRLMPRPYNVLEKFKCNNCGYRWDEFSEERIGD
ncbi:hypothetical protein C9994_03215 [Marivirga lumbricoides]|uniref:Uncharacterized protein n=1 Tax=Marivirga lumbricoides TaxID=1046115 RepID=A0A2T4DU74_9BACT|nr:hypothetical protein C9994_03215 [Marivirga lumbricoides]